MWSGCLFVTFSLYFPFGLQFIKSEIHNVLYVLYIIIDNDFIVYHYTLYTEICPQFIQKIQNVSSEQVKANNLTHLTVSRHQCWIRKNIEIHVGPHSLSSNPHGYGLPHKAV